MSYEAKFDPKAIDFLDSLPKNLKSRIFKKILSTKENPHRFFQMLSARKDYKLRIGAYRVIADIDEQNKLIIITHIGHRKNIYEKI